MFKIGDFSKLSQVSVRTLRYYEEMGLLKPIEVDRFTSYRYYSVDQLPRLNRILALKDLGLSLEQIAQMLDEGLPPAQIRGMLRMKQVEIQQQVGEEQARLARVEARLRQIEQEGKMPTYEVVIKKVEPQTVASLREVIPVPQDVGKMIERLFTHLGQRGVRPAGPPCAIWHDPEYHEGDIDTEVVVAIADALAASNGIKTTQLPGVEDMACAIHQGSYEGFSQAYAAIMGWIAANGYRIAGPIREIYLRGPGPTPTDPSTYVTEIQIPVEKPFSSNLQ
jgi:effector-binding domain-containing protein